MQAEVNPPGGSDQRKHPGDENANSDQPDLRPVNLRRGDDVDNEKDGPQADQRIRIERV